MQKKVSMYMMETKNVEKRENRRRLEIFFMIIDGTEKTNSESKSRPRFFFLLRVVRGIGRDLWRAGAVPCARWLAVRNNIPRSWRRE